LVPECMLIEPTETESKATMDEFIAVMQKILQEAKLEPEKVRGAPFTLPVRRLDDVKAAKELNLVWKEDAQEKI
jgi:glycine dehydrogenase subunit 2